MDEMSRRIQVMFKVIGFLACSDMVATAIILKFPDSVKCTLPPGRVTPLYGLYGDAPQDRVWFSSSLSYSGYIISHESVLNGVYNFAQVCPKQCAWFVRVCSSDKIEGVVLNRVLKLRMPS